MGAESLLLEWRKSPPISWRTCAAPTGASGARVYAALSKPAARRATRLRAAAHRKWGLHEAGVLRGVNALAALRVSLFPALGGRRRVNVGSGEGPAQAACISHGVQRPLVSAAAVAQAAARHSARAWLKLMC